MTDSEKKMYNPNPGLYQSPLRIHSWGYTTASGWNYAEEQTQMPYWRCYLNREDGPLLRQGAKIIPMSPQKVYLIAPETPFFCVSTEDFHQLYFHFSMDWQSCQPCNRIFSIPVWEDAVVFLEHMALHFDRRNQQHLLGGLGFLHTALSKLPEDVFRMPEASDPRIQQILCILNGNCIGHYTNRQLAGRIGMSENGFIQLFTECVGKPPQQYYREKRIERACCLLLFSPSSINAIAAETGFVDRYHFTRVFRQITGDTPGLYRRRHGPKSK
ncbi:MAG: HTH-type transcriptional activator Btr [Lentisphaerae bacterium ADurb.Bin242]|nr:MAG: HTH-type transcriptional activator Btr [Lentisphaerae bacterium ADurb.Bin242]